ncbi:hypothetical protein [Aquipuribacter nitratireducens]|uniref:N-acetyltransferase domain-containing protein n=1 Tax=Aquipuribacter nitratireducens TaxID=650104 RepID=A0ABW0GIL7_9MICO
MTEPPGPAERARRWLHDSAAREAAGRRSQALVCARTALALLERTEDETSVASARRRVEALAGPEVVPLHVDLPAGDGADPVEAGAVWVGAPADPVLGMLGWRERGGTLDVVRVVVPGTRRGRAAFATLLAALPDTVPVSVAAPARDTGVARLLGRAGFRPGARSPGGYVGGTLRFERDAPG